MNADSAGPAQQSDHGLSLSRFSARRLTSALPAPRHISAFCATLLIAASCSRPAPLEDRSQDTRVAAVPEARLPNTGLPEAPPPQEARRSEAAPRATSPDTVEAVPVPLPDGPALAPLVMAAPVYARPERAAERIGYLRIGARIARSEDAVSLRDCAGGWYAVRPVGFVCAGDDATLNLEHPATRALRVEPNRARPLPYSYAFLRSQAPNYLKVPTSEQQFTYEPRLARHLRSWKKLSDEWDALSVGANDVPLGPDGAALGPIPEHAQPLDMGARFGGDGTDQVPWWLEGGERRIPNLSGLQMPLTAVVSERSQRHAGVALIGSFVVGEGVQERRFAVTTDARLLPADKLKADAGSAFHGASVREVGLPIAFVRRGGVKYWENTNGRLVAREALGFRQFVALTGSSQDVGEERLFEARDGRWLRARDLKIAAKPRSLPWFAQHDRRWIDVSINHQILTLWEGQKPVYATLVSTGRDGTGDPSTTWSTPLGTFRIQQKHVTATMDSRAAETEFELRDVPWVMYFQGGYALHGAYWHDDFGRPRSHGCVNLSPIDARYVFDWSLPDVPPHWHGTYSSDTFGSGTMLRIGP